MAKDKIKELKEIIAKDDGYELFQFLGLNPDLNLMDKDNNYLIHALENNAVYCFDIIKDEIKSLKMQERKILKNQIKRNIHV